METFVKVFAGICLTFSSILIMVIVVSYVSVKNPSVQQGIRCLVDQAQCLP